MFGARAGHDRSKRVCPGCGQVKECNLAIGGGDWYTRRRQRPETAGEGVVRYSVDIIPSPYCRDCTIARNVESRRKRTLIDRLVKVSDANGHQQPPTATGPGTCEVCGDETENILVVDAPRVAFCCWRCAGLIGEGKERLVAMLRLLLAHIVRERDLEGATAHLARRVHAGNRFGSVDDHKECLGLEKRVREVVLWLLAAQT